MLGQTWYFSTIRKYVIYFGTIFNNLLITRTNEAGETIDLLKVPISYAPKEKMLVRFQNDPNIDRPFSTLLPRMSFEITGMRYDGARKLNTTGKSVVGSSDKSKMKYQYNPVPYNIDFRLYVYVKNAEDGTKIIEQILPYFTPDWTSTLELIPEMEINMDIPIILNTINIEDSYDGDFKERRALIWVLDFTLKGFLYGPVKSNKIIKIANTTFFFPTVSDGLLSTAVGKTSPAERITIKPGLTANGTPTSNAAISVPINQISATDDFGFIIEIDENPV